MSQLKDQMLMEMELRNCSPRTIQCYLSHMKRFTRFINGSPANASKEQIRHYLYHLVKERNLSWSNANIGYSAIRFFFIHVLHKSWNVEHIPRPKKEKKLPAILSRREIIKLFKVTSDMKYRMIFKTIYCGGLRVSEAAHLKIADIDSERMLIRVTRGKGKKDRDTLLSPVLLPELREYYRQYRPISWLFPGRKKTAPIITDCIQRKFRDSKKAAGIIKDATPHSLRHSFSTHFLENGGNVFTLKELLGHSDLRTTMIYVHTTAKQAAYIGSPLDRLAQGEKS